MSRTLAVETGCATEEQWNAGNSFEDIITCLRGKSPEELMDIHRKMEANGQQFNGPVIDDRDGVFPEDVNILMQKRKPYRMMIGTTDREMRIAKNLLYSNDTLNRQMLFTTCAIMAQTRGFKHPIAVGRACAEDYLKRRELFMTISDRLR